MRIIVQMVLRNLVDAFNFCFVLHFKGIQMSNVWQFLFERRHLFLMDEQGCEAQKMTQ